jgi:hypothetical protein
VSTKEISRQKTVCLIIEILMTSEEKISLNVSLEGFLAIHKDILYVKNQGILMRNDEDFKKNKNVIIISGGKIKFKTIFLGKNLLNFRRFWARSISNGIHRKRNAFYSYMRPNFHIAFCQ